MSNTIFTELNDAIKNRIQDSRIQLSKGKCSTALEGGLEIESTEDSINKVSMKIPGKDINAEIELNMIDGCICYEDDNTVYRAVVYSELGGDHRSFLLTPEGEKEIETCEDVKKMLSFYVPEDYSIALNHHSNNRLYALKNYLKQF